MKAAEATHCAGEQGKYWEMHDRLFANQRELAPPALSKHAEALGLDVQAFDQCLESGKSVARIRKDMGEAQKLQVSSTPPFFLGVTDPRARSSKARGCPELSHTRRSSPTCCRVVSCSGSEQSRMQKDAGHGGVATGSPRP